MKFLLLFVLLAPAQVCAAIFFTAGNLVVAVEGNGVQGAVSGPYTDNQAAPLSLFQFSVLGTSSALYVNSLVLPQIADGANYPVSGEYGSSSEGTLQLSGNGLYLTIAGYAINAVTFNSNPYAYDPAGDTKNTALAQTGSVTSQHTYVPVARVIALVDAYGNVNSTTALLNVFSGNNPRSVYTADGSSFYISGQGSSGDNTGGVFFTTPGSSSAVSITGADGGSGTSQDTRDVQIYNGQLYVSMDTKTGSNSDYIGTLGTAGNLPTTLANGGNGPTLAIGTTSTGKLTVTAATANGVNKIGQTVNLSPEQYFFAAPNVIYVADSGSPKNDSASSGLGDGGLQKWMNTKPDGSGAWALQYTLASGLSLVANSASKGATGLYGLAGRVLAGKVELYATNYTIGDLDPTFLYGITDTLAATSPGTEAFTVLAAAPADSKFKGVSFAPSTVPVHSRRPPHR